MFEDPIVEEVRRERDLYAARFDYDLDRIFEDIQRREQQHPDRIVRKKTVEPRPVVTEDPEKG